MYAAKLACSYHCHQGMTVLSGLLSNWSPGRGHVLFPQARYAWCALAGVHVCWWLYV